MLPLSRRRFIYWMPLTARTTPQNNQGQSVDRKTIYIAAAATVAGFIAVKVALSQLKKGKTNE